MILIQVAVLISAESVAAFLTFSADHSVGATSLFGRCKAAAVGVQASRATPLAISTNLRINIEQMRFAKNNVKHRNLLYLYVFSMAMKCSK
jgi:hypothetical protein